MINMTERPIVNPRMISVVVRGDIGSNYVHKTTRRLLKVHRTLLNRAVDIEIGKIKTQTKGSTKEKGGV